MTAATLLVVSLLCTAPSKQAVLGAVQEDFERAGRAAPLEDEGLSRAAAIVARRALGAGVEEAASLVRVTAAVSANGGWDPNPTTVVIRGDAGEVLATLAKNALAEEPASLIGVAIEQDEARAAIAVLIARRRMELEPFARSFQRPTASPQRLCGRLRAPLTSAELFVTRPGGDVEHLELAGRERLCASLSFASQGRHTVEVLAKGPRGPEVAALFFVDVGAVSQASEDGAGVEPATDADARAQLLVRINALRLRMGLQALKPDAALDQVAQDWAARLARENFFSHVAPDGSDLKKRLQDGGYAFAAAGENLGLSSGPLAAHFGIEHSPGHRNNLLEKAHQRLGIGLARRADGLTVLVEVLARAGERADPVDSADPVRAAYDALSTERARRGLPRLVRSPVLEALAQQHARDALDAQIPRAALPGRKRLHDLVFESVEAAKTVSVDVFVAQSPRLIVESKNLLGPQGTMVGVGVARGDSAKYGNGRYWIVVIYAGPN
jgi:uncharacterized protein YkwD